MSSSVQGLPIDLGIVLLYVYIAFYSTLRYFHLKVPYRAHLTLPTEATYCFGQHLLPHPDAKRRPCDTFSQSRLHSQLVLTIGRSPDALL